MWPRGVVVGGRGADELAGLIEIDGPPSVTASGAQILKVPKVPAFQGLECGEGCDSPMVEAGRTCKDAVASLSGPSTPQTAARRFSE